MKRVKYIFFTIMLLLCIGNLAFADVAIPEQCDIKIDWTLFPRVYCANTTVFIPVKFTVTSSEPKKFDLTPLIITKQTSQVTIPKSTPDIVLDENCDSQITFIPFEVGSNRGQTKLGLVFIDSNGVIYENVEYDNKLVDVFIVSPWTILILLFLNVFIIAFYKQYIIKLFKLRENKKVKYILNTFLIIEIFLFSYIFMAPWNISVAVSLILIAFLLSNAKSTLFMPFVFTVQLLLLESYMDLIFSVDKSALMISFSAIIMTASVLFLITFFLRRFGSIMCMLLSMVGLIYYVAQLYYQSFFQDFFPIASIYKVKVAGELSESVISLTTSDELMIFFLLLANIVVFWLYRVYSKTEIKEEKEKELLLLAGKTDNDILEKRQIKTGFARMTTSWASIRGFHKM